MRDLASIWRGGASVLRVGSAACSSSSFETELNDNERWGDVYLDYRQFDAVRVQGGKFKLPFSLDENTSAANLDFVYRSMVRRADAMRACGLEEELSGGPDRSARGADWSLGLRRHTQAVHG
jgi:hypothetical protein